MKLQHFKTLPKGFLSGTGDRCGRATRRVGRRATRFLWRRARRCRGRYFGCYFGRADWYSCSAQRWA
eukprot:3789098-Pleurochrysis_carterae.AAC.2